MKTFKLTKYYSGFCTRYITAETDEEAIERDASDPDLDEKEINEIMSSLEPWTEADTITESSEEEARPADAALELNLAPFTWSFFAPPADKIPLESQYPDAVTADRDVKFMDGQQAFDTGRPVRMKVFGIYRNWLDHETAGEEGWELIANYFDKDRTDLVGCATVKDWEWEAYQGGDDGFDSGQILEDLSDKVWDLSERLHEIMYEPLQAENNDLGVKATGDLIAYLRSVESLGNAPEMFDLYHTWRALHAIQMEIVSGAEVYPSVSATLNAIMAITDALVDKITDGDTDVPEEYIINQFKH